MMLDRKKSGVLRVPTGFEASAHGIINLKISDMGVPPKCLNRDIGSHLSDSIMQETKGARRDSTSDWIVSNQEE